MVTLNQRAMSQTDTVDVVAASIRPNAVVDLVTGYEIARALEASDVRLGGLWLVRPAVWQRFDRPWESAEAPGGARLIGSIYVRHGTPRSYDVTVEQVTITPYGVDKGWTPESLGNSALETVGLRLSDPQLSHH